MAQASRVVRDDRGREDHRRRIRGWGADLDSATRPGIPREKLLPPGIGQRWPEREIPNQPASIKIFVSAERKDRTPVFGTSCPPRGLSGKLRAYGYRFGEARLLRWLPLLVADRVDVVEGIVIDLAHGRVTNPLAEKGMGAQLRYSPRFRATIALGIFAVALAGLFAAGSRGERFRATSRPA